MVSSKSPRVWFEKFTWSVKKQGCMQGKSDHTLFMRFSDDGKVEILIAYVDDIIYIGDDIVGMGRLKENMTK